MATTPQALPSYSDPPLNEIAIAVQFGELDRLNSTHYGSVYDLFKAELPNVEEYGQIPAKFETFPGALSSAFQLKFETQEKPPLPRVWLVSADGHELVQIQPDCLIRNWRKVDHQGTYPRFETILPKFLDTFDRFAALITKLGLGPVVPNQCELSYFNNIFLPEGQGFVDAYGWFFGPSVRLNTPSVEGLEADTARFTTVSRIVGGDGNPIGRLYVEANSAAMDGRQMIRLQIVARGRPASEKLDDVEAFLSTGHVKIVSAFDAMISDQAKQLWGKQ